MSEPTRLLLILDAFSGVGTDEWSAAIPVSPKPEHILALSAFGAPRAEPGTLPTWIELGAAVERLADAALALTSNTTHS